MSIAVEQMKAITRRFVLEPWGKGNVDVFDEVCAPNYRCGELDVPKFKTYITDLRRVVPDLTVEIYEMIAEGDLMAYKWTMKGTHRGPYLGLAPTGKPVMFTGITILRFENGKIVDDQFQSSSPPFEQQVAS